MGIQQQSVGVFMKLKKLTKAAKDIFYNSFAYSIYSNYILTIPLFRVFIDIGYMGEKLQNSFIFSTLFSFGKKILYNLPQSKIKLNHVVIFILVFIVSVLPEIKYSPASAFTLMLSVLYIIKNKDNKFFVYSVITALFLIFLKLYGAEQIISEVFKLWCCGSVFYLTYNLLKTYEKAKFLKFLHYLNIAACFAVIADKNDIYTGKIVLYLMPFSIVHVVMSYEKIKKVIIFSIVILISVFAGISEGGTVLSGIALEIVMFCILFDPKYIFAALLVTPASIAVLIKRLLFVQREVLSAGITARNIIAIYRNYINNGLKSDIYLFKKALEQNNFAGFHNISFGEQLFVYYILILSLITALFLGRYILRLIKRTVIKLNNENMVLKPALTGAISFFAGASFVSIFLPEYGNLNSMLLYWILLGFIKILSE